MSFKPHKECLLAAAEAIAQAASRKGEIVSVGMEMAGLLLEKDAASAPPVPEYQMRVARLVEAERLGVIKYLAHYLPRRLSHLPALVQSVVNDAVREVLADVVDGESRSFAARELRRLDGHDVDKEDP